MLVTEITAQSIDAALRKQLDALNTLSLIHICQRRG